MSSVGVMFSVITAGIGICTGIRLVSGPIKIEFKISVLNIFQLALSMFGVISCAIAIELIFNQWQLAVYQLSGGCLKLFSELINGGLVIGVLLPILSVLFGKWVQKFDLDLCSVYSENMIKIYYSCVIFANCIFYVCIIYEGILTDVDVIQNIFNRVVIWLLNILGTWVGIGFHCEGRIAEERKNIIRSKKDIDRKNLIKHIVIYGIAFLICCFMMFFSIYSPQKLGNLLKEVYIIAISFIVFMFFTGIIGISLICPSEKRSNRKLSKVIRRMAYQESVTARYQRIPYSLVRRDGKKYIEIGKQDVRWLGHENEVKENFIKEPYEVEEFEYQICQKYLFDVLKQQRDFIKKGFDSCREKALEKLIKE